MDDFEYARVPKSNRSCGEKLAVERIELIRVGVSPKSESVDSSDDLESALKRPNDIFAAEAIRLSTDFRNLRVFSFREFIHDLFHHLEKPGKVYSSSSCELC